MTDVQMRELIGDVYDFLDTYGTVYEANDPRGVKQQALFDRMRAAKKIVCDWCGCEAWWPQGEGIKGCDCQRTIVFPDGHIEVPHEFDFILSQKWRSCKKCGKVENKEKPGMCRREFPTLSLKESDAIDANLALLSSPVAGMVVKGEGFEFEVYGIETRWRSGETEPIPETVAVIGAFNDRMDVRILTALVKANAATVSIPSSTSPETPIEYEDVWTDEQVAEKNAAQGGYGHPMTCGGDRRDDAHRTYRAEYGGDFGELVATRKGWVCPVPGCGYKQGWRIASPESPTEVEG